MYSEVVWTCGFKAVDESQKKFHNKQLLHPLHKSISAETKETRKLFLRKYFIMYVRKDKSHGTHFTVTT